MQKAEAVRFGRPQRSHFPFFSSKSPRWSIRCGDESVIHCSTCGRALRQDSRYGSVNRKISTGPSEVPATRQPPPMTSTRSMFIILRLGISSNSLPSRSSACSLEAVNTSCNGSKRTSRFKSPCNISQGVSLPCSSDRSEILDPRFRNILISSHLSI